MKYRGKRIKADLWKRPAKISVNVNLISCLSKMYLVEKSNMDIAVNCLIPFIDQKKNSVQKRKKIK
tara:strand:- start:83 stop:280 length:198 start_codon:yes stop_codon:yes gene_type:complete